jgi:hypothetical protein
MSKMSARGVGGKKVLEIDNLVIGFSISAPMGFGLVGCPHHRHGAMKGRQDLMSCNLFSKLVRAAHGSPGLLLITETVISSKDS